MCFCLYDIGWFPCSTNFLKVFYVFCVNQIKPSDNDWLMFSLYTCYSIINYLPYFTVAISLGQTKFSHSIHYIRWYQTKNMSIFAYTIFFLFHCLSFLSLWLHFSYLAYNSNFIFYVVFFILQILLIVRDTIRSECFG